MKYLALLLFTIVFLVSCSGRPDGAKLTDAESNGKAVQADILSAENRNLEADYETAEDRLAEIRKQLNRPNVLKEDILRGWYLGGENDRKFGTPDTWIFVEDGANSKWMSPNALEEEDLIDNRELCHDTAGAYVTSCVESSDSDCEYVDESHCQCSAGSGWAEGQGCILTTERGSFVSINNSELEQGWYLGLPNEKKLNTPADWVWVEEGKESMWTKN